MKNLYIVIIAVLIVINAVSFLYGRKFLSNVKNDKNNASEETYKKGLKYVVFSVILSFATIIVITVMLLLEFL